MTKNNDSIKIKKFEFINNHKLILYCCVNIIMIFTCNYVDDKLNVNYISPNDSFFDESIQVFCYEITNLNFTNLKYICSHCNSKQCEHIEIVENYIHNLNKEDLLYFIEDISCYLDNILILCNDFKIGFIERWISARNLEHELFNIKKFGNYINNNLTKLEYRDVYIGIDNNICIIKKILLVQRMICYLIMQHCDIRVICCLGLLSPTNEDESTWLWTDYFSESINNKYSSNKIGALDMYIYVNFNKAKLKIYKKIENFITTIVYDNVFRLFNCKIMLRSNIRKSSIKRESSIVFNVIIFHNDIDISTAVNNFLEKNIFLIE